MEKIAEKNTVYVGTEPISDYIDKSIGYGFALALIVILGTGIIMLNAIKHGSPDIKYHFWTAKLFGFLNGVLLIIKGIIYDAKLLEEKRLIAQANEEVKNGHGVPVFAFLFLGFGLALLSVFLCMCYSGQNEYYMIYNI